RGRRAAHGPAALLHARPRGDGRGRGPAHPLRLPRQPEQPDRDHLPAGGLGGLSRCHARPRHRGGGRCLRRVRRRPRLPRHDRAARRRVGPRRHAPDVLQALRACGAAGRLCRGAAAADRDPRPRAPALQRERAGPDRGVRRARRRGARPPHAGHQPRGHGVPDRGLRAARPRVRAERGQLRPRAGRRGRARLRGAPARRRHRASDGRLRLPGARAGDGRAPRGERAVRRGARPRARRRGPMTPLFARVAIAGVGLVGGSLAVAARAAGLVGEVIGYGRGEANLRLAQERGLVDRVAREPAAAVADADLIVLAVPVGASTALAEVFRPHARPGAILTDVGSVKAGVVEALEARWPERGLVVGAHPIAGGEVSGAGAARADLFRGRRCILTPTPATDREALARVRALWEGVGAVVEEMPAALHDEILARVSHLPHLAAYALVAAFGETRVAGRRVLDYAGSGYRDTTRIAASRPELWRDIALANRAALRGALVEFRAALDRLEGLVVAG